MALLSKADILAATDLKTADIEVPEWGGTVRIRAMNAAEREVLETELLHARNDGQVAPPDWRARHVAMFAVDDSGAPLFSESEAKALGQKSAVALARVFDAIMTLNRVGSIEDAAGN